MSNLKTQEVEREDYPQLQCGFKANWRFEKLNLKEQKEVNKNSLMDPGRTSLCIQNASSNGIAQFTNELKACIHHA